MAAVPEVGFSFWYLCDRAPVVQLVEHRAAMREVVRSTPAERKWCLFNDSCP